MTDEFLIFDIWGEVAHFRRYDTTSSPLCWPFPPRPTVLGILGAILGFHKNTYLEEFQDEEVTVAVSIQQRPRSLRVAYNETETKNVSLFRTVRHTQIRREILADARYRIFFRHPNRDLQTRLTELVHAHQSIYTVSLGHASMLADFAFVASVAPEPLTLMAQAEVVTVVPFDLAQPVSTPQASPLLINSMPRHMTAERVVTAFQDIIFDARRPSILIRPRQNSSKTLIAHDFGELGLVVPL